MNNHPILIMIGGMRCGTRALQRYLSQHPQILPHKKAHDPHFFSSGENWAKGVDAYLEGWASFDPSKHKYRFEASTHYTKYPNVPSVPERMRESGLNLEFIYGVRDPLARIESHMQHNAGKGYFDPTDPERRRRFLNAAINYSNYSVQLNRFERVFEKKQIFVYAMEYLRDNPTSVLDPLGRFLGLDQKFKFKPVKRIGTSFTVPVDNVCLTDAERAEVVKRIGPDISRFMERFDIDPKVWGEWSDARHKYAGPISAATAPLPEAPSVRRTYSGAGRFAFLTVDTEALPKRASDQHVKRLIWGEFDKGTAGIREMSAIGNEFSARHVFFVDMCEMEFYGEQMAEVVRWLRDDGQDVQLHAHPELLPAEFWEKHGFPATPRMMNRYDRAKARLVLAHFSKELKRLTGKPVHAYRAGSFRWNGDTIRAMADVGIPLSFNDTLRLHQKGRNPYSSGNSKPYRWDNDIIELPLTERNCLLSGKRSAFVFPASTEGDNDVRQIYEPFVRGSAAPSLLVLLTHSWSLLHWDSEGMAEYRSDARKEEYRNLIKNISKDYDIITSSEFLSLQKQDPTVFRMPQVPLQRTEGARKKKSWQQKKSRELSP